MRLAELEPQFVVREVREDGVYHVRTDALAQAQGVRFLCPKCFAANGGAVGTHMVLCWAPGVPADAEPGPGRWPMTGTSLEDLTLTPSIQLNGGCAWHGFVRDGEVIHA